MNTSQGYTKNILKNPDGTDVISESVNGIAFKTSTILASNATVTTGWIEYGQYLSASTTIFSDVIGNIKYEYSTDGGITILDTINIQFTTLNDFRVATFPLGKGTHIKITYINGTIAQKAFYFSLALSLQMINSQGSVSTTINKNNIASITKTFLQVPDTNTQAGVYDFITRTGNALNVNVTNSSAPTENSLETTQLLVKSKTDNLDVALSTRLKASDTLNAIGSITNTVVVKADTLANQVNAFKVDGSATTQPISVITLPLPTNASTSVLQTSGNLSLSSIDAKTPNLGQQLAVASQPVVLTAAQLTTLTPQTNSLTDSQLRANPIGVTGAFFQTVQPVSIASIPLAIGSATAALQTTQQTSLSNIDSKLTDNATAANQTVQNTNLTSIKNSLIDGTQKTKLYSETKGTSITSGITSTNIDANTQALDVNIKGGTTGTTSTFNTTSPTLTNGQTVPLQSNINGSLKVDGSAVIQPISGSIIVNAGTNLNTSLLAADITVNSLLKPASTLAAVTTLGTITNALPIGNNTIGNTNQTLATAQFSKITDGINTVTIKPASTTAVATDTAIVTTLSPNSATQNTSDASNGSVVAGVAGTKSSLAGLQFNTTLPTLTTGQQVATQGDNSGRLITSPLTNSSIVKSQLQDNTGTAITLGQKISASSLPVVISSDQTNLPSNITQVAGIAIQQGSGTSTSTIRVELPTNGTGVVGLNAGINIVGKFGIDQTTQGTTNFVTSNAVQINSQPIAIQNGVFNNATQRVVLANRTETQVGSIATSADIVPTAGQRIKTLTFTNNTAAVVFVQIFNKATALVLNDIPLNGLIFRVPANSTLDKTVADFGEAGILYGVNTRIGLSSTFGTYTAIIPANTSINIITVA